MANLMEKAREQIDALLADACAKAAAEGLFPADAALKGSVEVPKEARNGDYAANHAMAGAKALRMPPRRIAEILTDRLALEDSYFASAEIAGPGFINFRLSEKWYAAVLSAALVLHERLTLRDGLGCTVMFTAVVLSQLTEIRAARTGKDRS